ncbi:MAG: hypothetical protein ABI171_06525 [Collimonas sp.]|uniref:hypothetical protein n=1 Tax=Collimonas sp. TaxID=1963772 RepID=UPI0032634B52
MRDGVDLLVPAGAVISDGRLTIRITEASTLTIYTKADAFISVPSASKGVAGNLITTAKAPAGAISTTQLPVIASIAGNPTSTDMTEKHVDGTGAAAVFSAIRAIKFDPNGNIIVSDDGVIRRVTPAGVVTTLNLQPKDRGLDGIAVDSTGNIYGSFMTVIPAPWVGPPSERIPTYGGTIRVMDIAGKTEDFSANWIASSTEPFIALGDLVADSQGNLFLASPGTNNIIKFTSWGSMSVFVGNGTEGNNDGRGRMATLSAPSHLAIDANDNLYFVDRKNATIRKATPDGTVTTIAAPPQGDSNLDTKLSPLPIPAPYGPIAIDLAGNIYFEMPFGFLAKIDIRGFITSYYPTDSSTMGISSMIADNKGNLYLGTNGSAQIRKVSF